jgi:RNA polymerase sigma factor (sigma-70 family)
MVTKHDVGVELGTGAACIGKPLPGIVREPLSGLRTTRIVPSHPADNVLIAESFVTPASFGPIFDRHFDRIHGYLQRQLGTDLADDLASETFLVAFDRRASFDLGHESARPWLFGIAANLTRRHHRDVRRRLNAYARAGADPVLDAFDGIEEKADAAALRGTLGAALSRLPKEELETLLLHAWAELTYSETAEALEVPVGTVRSRLNRTRGRLREPLAGERASTETSTPVGQNGSRMR